MRGRGLLPRTFSFDRSIVFAPSNRETPMATGRCKGNPLAVHFRLPIEEKYFSRRLKLFKETAIEVMSPPHAAIVSQKAHLVAINIKRILASPSETSEHRECRP
jgi:truncated hemoglobin YjbI